MGSGKKKGGILSILKIIGLALFICFLPNLRSCGSISLGFPSVVIGSPEKDLEDFRPLNLAINLGFIGLSALGFFLINKRIKNDQTRTCVRSGVLFLELYQLFILFGYAVLYPLLTINNEDSVLSAITMAYGFFIHPYLGIIHEVSYQFPDSLKTSFLFGDSLDLPMRIGYVLMSGAWFALGALKARIFKGKKPAAGPPGNPGGYPVDLP